MLQHCQPGNALSEKSESWNVFALSQTKTKQNYE